MKNYNVNYRCRKAAFLLVLALLSALLLSCLQRYGRRRSRVRWSENGSESDV